MPLSFGQWEWDKDMSLQLSASEDERFIFFLSQGWVESTEGRLRDEIQVESIFLLYSHRLQLFGLDWPAWEENGVKNN